MKNLPKTFTGKGEVKGNLFYQLKQSDRAYLYEVNSGSLVYYEVFKRRVNKRFNCISYPTSKAFDLWAWTYINIDSAFVKFNFLNSHD